MYPLNMKLADPLIGFAVANDEAEHQSLTGHGYLPAWVAPGAAAAALAAEAPAAPAAPDLDALRAQAAAKGIKVDRRWSAARLAEEIAKA